MKKSLLVLAIGLMSTSAFAGTGDIGSVGTSSADIDHVSLELLLRENPIAKGEFGVETKTKVSTIVARGIVSLFDSSRGSNFVALSVTTNKCEQIAGTNTFECGLHMNNADMVIENSGDYASAPDRTESSYIISYKFTLGKDGKNKISDVRWFLAG